MAKTKPFVFAVVVLLFGSSTVFARPFSLDLVYCDFNGGPLADNSQKNSFFPDGSLCQLIQDIAQDGINPPDMNGVPSSGDELIRLESFSSGSQNFFLNGESVFHQAGYFYFPSALVGQNKFSAPLYLRIWNAPAAHQATAYFDTPLYTVTEGYQQMNFSRDQLSFHEYKFASPQQNLNAVEKNLDDSSLGVNKFALHEAYPNPFNSQTTLSFDLPNSDIVKLVLYDILGREVRVLLNEFTRSGHHQFNLDASRLSSGLYFVTLKSGGNLTASRRLNLLK